jgi:hypothetical protein
MMANLISSSAAAEARNESDSQNTHPQFSSTKPRAAEKSDDLILSLSDAYENRRARQVGEWERLYGRNVYLGA